MRVSQRLVALLLISVSIYAIGQQVLSTDAQTLTSSTTTTLTVSVLNLTAHSTLSYTAFTTLIVSVTSTLATTSTLLTMDLGLPDLLLTSVNFALVYLVIGVGLFLLFGLERVNLFDIAAVFSLENFIEFLVAHAFFAAIAVVIAYFVQSWFGVSSTTGMFTVSISVVLGIEIGIGKRKNKL